MAFVDPVIYRNLSSLSSASTPVDNFRKYVDMMSVAVPADELKRFRAVVGDKTLPGLEKATAQLERWAPRVAATTTHGSNDNDNGKDSAATAAAAGHHHFFSKMVPFLLDRALEYSSLFPGGKLPFSACPTSLKKTKKTKASQQKNSTTNNNNDADGDDDKAAATAAAESSSQQRVETRLELSRRQALCIHALCFLGADPHFEPRRNDVGNLSWWQLFWSGTSCIAVERIMCQLLYFEFWRALFGDLLDDEKRHDEGDIIRRLLDERITYIRVSFPAAAPDGGADVAKTDENCKQIIPVWEESNELMVRLPPPSANKSSDAAAAATDDNHPHHGDIIATRGAHIEAKFMEEFSEAGALVDFANEQLMIGRLIPSMTQEEALFSVRPELLVSLLLFDTMRPEEAIVMRGARIFATYQGYRGTFRLVAPAPSLSVNVGTTIQNAQEIIAIDAHVNFGGQFLKEAVDRDLLKIFAGFSAAQNHIIATGPFGCGAFGGDVFLKFLQQLMGAAVTTGTGSSTATTARKFLCYYERAPAPFNAILDLLRLKKVTVAQAYAWILEYGSSAELTNKRRTMMASDAPPPIQTAAGRGGGGGGGAGAGLPPLSGAASASALGSNDNRQSLQSVEAAARTMIARSSEVPEGSFGRYVIDKLLALERKGG